MARTMRMPSEDDLPPGTVRDFVELLFWFYRAARRPTMREISDRIQKMDLPGTASDETIRRMMHGKTVPAHWETVNAVLEALCDLAGADPDGEFYWRDDDGSRRWHLERLWHQALDEPDKRYRRPAPDPWSDEPPF